MLLAREPMSPGHLADVARRVCRCRPDTWPMSPGVSADVTRTPSRRGPMCWAKVPAGLPGVPRPLADVGRSVVGCCSVRVPRPVLFRPQVQLDQSVTAGVLSPTYSCLLSDLLRSTLRPPLVDSRTGFDTRADQHRSTRVSTPCALWPRLNQGRDEVVVFSDRRPPPIGQHRLVIRATAMTTVDS